MLEKRKFTRLKAPIGMSYKLIKKNKRQKTSLTWIKNISGGGVKIVAKDDLRKGDLLDIEIQIPHLKNPIRALGEVTWFSQPREKEWAEGREAGVRFRDIEPRDLHRILEFVHTIGIG